MNQNYLKEMCESNNIETDCPICFDSMTEENCIKFDCNHIFCQSCSKEIIFNSKCECPLDRKTFQTIYVQGQILPIVQYQLIIWNERSLSIKAKIENYWYGIIHQVIKSIKTITDNLKLIKEKFENDSTIDNDDFKTLKNRLQEFYISMKNFIYSDRDERVMIDDLRIIFSQCLGQYQNPLEINIFNSAIMENIRDFYRQIHRFNQSINIGEINIDQCRQMFQHFNDLASEKFQYVISLAISHLSDNEEIYQFAQPHVKPIDTKKCLICCEEIDIMKYVSFSTCSHKICSECIDKFMITYASCPFDGKQLSNLLVFDDYQEENKAPMKVLEYLINNYQSIIDKILNKFQNPIYYSFFVQILEIYKQFPNLINHLKIMDQELASDNPSIDLINIIKDECKMVFENIPQESCSNIFLYLDWNIEMYMKSLTRIIHMVSDNTLVKCYFKQALDKLWKMNVVALCCASFLECHFHFREYVLDNQIDYELIVKYLQINEDIQLIFHTHFMNGIDLSNSEHKNLFQELNSCFELWNSKSAKSFNNLH